MSNVTKKHTQLTKFNAVQLNLVTFVDVHKANRNRSLGGCIHAMDNGVKSKYEGSGFLQTTCKQGQILNWIIYAIDAVQRSDGSWPPSVRINNIVFQDEQGEHVSDIRICEPLKIYGSPDKMRSPVTPVYYYWAGEIDGGLEPGIYQYRLIFELDQEDSSKKLYLNAPDNFSLNVLPIEGNIAPLN